MTVFKASNKYKQVQLQLFKKELQAWTHRSSHSFLVIQLVDLFGFFPFRRQCSGGIYKYLYSKEQIQNAVSVPKVII